MPKCRDCLHWEACREYVTGLAATRGVDLDATELEQIFDSDDCDHFHDSSRFVELPYKLGDNIYEPKRHQITEYQIARIVFYDFGLRMELRLMKGLLFRVEIKQEDIGKVVFLTREEAEQALKERDSNAGRNDI